MQEKNRELTQIYEENRRCALIELPTTSQMVSLELKGTMTTEKDGMEDYVQQYLDNQRGQTGNPEPETEV